ncbi:MAG TPA: methylcrotonoyl-CoA carboxylase [Oceanicaulis sp.]|uniref:3-methylcrotonyl-CoA carboxylase subunit alpha n=1 Tax=Glycocaulis albus TaxID=1382801 RepID=A0ABQ1XTG6_9PROT|nr:acetyl/propionyl/methylcrotonyl-CoA carboxylase subunit alpha [Glycocaulis albus]GGH02411.1 3-methylcrotonyl-CoA carboxylase subunit alpha [Glycocaulis albus]HCY56964.1 methylcrotonoyl-CoA carboxylase [Oceanicaulis sp.]
MIKKLLIANRGEIACRVIRSARQMGIATVAVYSDADRRAPHVKMADEAVHIGPAPARESYLVADRIIKAAKDTGADAIHPGYGFLSENAGFARECAKNDIIFVGPSPEAIDAMGLKDRAKALMEKAGVPVTPGYHGENQDPDFLKEQADQIGYPVLIKAVAGGGGKGMRKVEKSADFAAALDSCKREAASSFGDVNVLIEKYITSPRHIEVQVFGDSHGQVIHLFERDCSLQRRHQKVLEEAPAPGMSAAVREAMCSAAVRAAQAVNYAGAGTVEFIVDGSGELRADGFYFMEMNTRLQVEHPVTEMVTGLDLVKLQLEVAAGGKVPPQDEITLSGHAIEARLYAEDPATGFLPSTGPLTLLSLPEWQRAIRVDSGVEQGGEVTMFYDPMIAKIIAHGEDRTDAIDRLVDAIDSDVGVWPVRTNAGFLRAALSHGEFRAGDVYTGFIEKHLDALVPTGTPVLHFAAAGLAALSETGDPVDPWSRRSGFRLNAPARLETVFDSAGERCVVRLNEGDIAVGGQRITVRGVHDASDAVTYAELADDSGASLTAIVDHRADGWLVTLRGQSILVRPFGAGADIDALAGGDAIKAPMPGKLLSLSVKEGDTVTKGQTLAVMEAMKMEMALTAPRDGVIETVNAAEGQQVNEGDVLIALAEEAG